MEKVYLELTLKGHKHTFFKRFDVYGIPVLTNNKNNARQVKKSDIPSIIKALIKEHGKDNVKDINIMKE